MKRFFTLLAIIVQAALCRAQNISGTWNGILEADGVKLTLVLHIGEQCRLDVPSQNAKDIPVEVWSKEPLDIRLGIPTLGASYSGIWLNKKIIGSFMQAGREFPLTFNKGEVKISRPQTPVPPFPYTTEEVAFQSLDATLCGTLTMPEGTMENTPVVLLISGSGLQDRDEEIMGHRPFAVMADAFAKAGIATLRYDDRGFGKSTGNAADATTETFYRDARSAIAFLRDLGFKNIGAAGHSEGGTISFMLAAKDSIDFMISMAGMAETGKETLYRQTVKLLTIKGTPEAEAQAYAKDLVSKSAATGSTWMKYFLEFAPAPYIAAAECPILAINGEKDCQVICEANLNKIKELQHLATIIAYPNLNHLFQNCVTGDPAEYYGIEETISQKVLDDMIRWIKDRL